MAAGTVLDDMTPCGEVITYEPEAVPSRDLEGDVVDTCPSCRPKREVVVIGPDPEKEQHLAQLLGEPEPQCVAEERRRRLWIRHLEVHVPEASRPHVRGRQRPRKWTRAEPAADRQAARRLEPCAGPAGQVVVERLVLHTQVIEALAHDGERGLRTNLEGQASDAELRARYQAEHASRRLEAVLPLGRQVFEAVGAVGAAAFEVERGRQERRGLGRGRHRDLHRRQTLNHLWPHPFPLHPAEPARHPHRKVASVYTFSVAADRLAMYEAMARIREFEELVARARDEGHLPGLLHLSTGGEAVAVGVLGLLREHDRVYTSHRGHGHFLAAGEELRAVLAELAGRTTGLCRGYGGSMHLMGRRAVLATGIVGGSLPIALGHALALPDDAVSIAFFGDGAVQTGVFHETLNLATLWRARVLFVCENNGWAEFTPRDEHTTVEAVTAHAQAYGMPAETIDGGDVLTVRAAAGRLLLHVRSGGPALLECQFTRMRPHYEGDLRPSAAADPRDPMRRFAAALAEDGEDEATLAAVRRTATVAAERALADVLADPPASPHDAAQLVFSRQP